MKIHRSMRKILLSAGIALGIITVGATTNAKANEVNSNDTSTNQSLNNNQISSGNKTLVNQSNHSPVSTAHNAAPKYSGYQLYSTNNRNYQNPQMNAQFRPRFHNSLSRVYKNILLHHEHQFRLHYRHNNIQHNKAFSAHTHHTRRISVTYSRHSAHMGSNFNRSRQVTGIHYHHDWFRDGLSHRNLSARNWISWHESSHRWNVLSYGGVCVGYFQLNPHYLGYRHGHVDLRPKHQVKVADRYVRGRYGNWVNAKRFWVTHHWY